MRYKLSELWSCFTDGETEVKRHSRSHSEVVIEQRHKSGLSDA